MSTPITGTIVEHQGTKVNLTRTDDLTEAEARALTTEIQHVTVRMWMLVAEAHDRKAWKALGYQSWKQYVVTELQMTEQRSFQLLDQAKIMAEIEAAGVDALAIEPPPSRVVQKVKGDMRGVRRVVKKVVRKGGEPEEIVQALRDLAATNDAKKAKNRGEDAEPGTTRQRPAAKVTTTTTLVDDSDAKPPRGQRWCPACNGFGIVSKKDYETLQPLAVQFRSAE